MEDRRAPLSFDLEVTARCNNDCRHCYINLPAGDREARARELSLQEILKHRRGSRFHGGRVVPPHRGRTPAPGGLFRDLPGLEAPGAAGLGVHQRLPGHPRARELFTKYPPRDLEVTVYGVTPETYERVTRRPGSFAAFRRGLDLLLQGGSEGAPEGHGPEGQCA